MKIVHLCLSSFYIDNYSYQENMLPKYHVKQGHKVTVIASLVSFDKYGKPCLLNEESTYITDDCYKVIRLDYKRPFYTFNKLIRIYRNTYRTICDESPDIIFIHDFSFMDILDVIKYIRNNNKVKVFVDCHTDFINSGKNWVSKYVFHYFIWMIVGKILSPHVEKFYGVTPLRYDFLKNVYRINPNKIELLVMGIDDEVLKRKDKSSLKLNLKKSLNIKTSDFIILTGGKIDEKKNIHIVMQAIINLGLKNVKLIVFGTVAPEMEFFFKSLLRNDLIVYLGWLNTNQIFDYLLISDLVVFPGTHSVLWEQAVGAGIPCVFKYWKGMTHVDVGGNCKFLYNDSVNEMEKVIKQIVEDETEFDKMKTISESVSEQFFYSTISKHSIKY